MSTYAEPSRWNKKTKEADARSNKLREEVDTGAVSQRFNKMSGISKYKKDEYDATNALLNIKEEEIEALDQQIADQYPKGTHFSTGKTSRNKAEYGKPVELPKYKKGGMTASSRADGIAQRGKTKGRFI
jgi:hypothetical protein